MKGSIVFRILGIVDVTAALILIYTRDASPLPFLNLILAAVLLLKGLMSLA